MSRFWNERLANLSPYVPGEQPKASGITKLNTNENPYGPSPKVIAAIQNELGSKLRLYPDPAALELRQSIAKRYGIDADEVFVGNGSDEVLALAFMAFFSPNKEIRFPNITYSFYQVYANLFQIPYICPALQADLTVNLQDYVDVPGGILMTNPNAPTSISLTLDEIKQLLEQNKDCIVIIDEAYIDFGGVSAVSLIPDYENLLVIQTFSKSRSLAGSRIGFTMGQAPLIQGLEIVKNSFNSYPLDRLALVAAQAAIEDEGYFQETISKIIQTRVWTIGEMEKLGFVVMPSHANFIFATHPEYNAEQLFLALREKNIFVRYFKQVEISNYLRITIGTDDEMRHLMKEIENFIE